MIRANSEQIGVKGSSSMLEMSEREDNGVTIFTANGRVDSEGVSIFETALQHALLAGKYRLVIDMSRVRYLNSAALRAMADTVSRCRASQGDLRLAAPAPKVQQIFEIAGFNRYFAIFDTVEQAAASFA
jgi:anti-sigma B factor antagonist